MYCNVSAARRARADTPDMHLWPQLRPPPEPTGIACSKNKRLDWISVKLWKKGQMLVWDATCPDTFAPSHMSLAARDAGFAASEARKAKSQSTFFSAPATTCSGGHRDLRSIWVYGHFLGCRIRAELLVVFPAGPFCCHLTGKCRGSDGHLTPWDSFSFTPSYR